MKRLIFPLCIVFLAAACVPAKQYNDLKAAQEKCENERQELTSKNRSLTADNEDLKTEIARLNRISGELKSDTVRLGQKARDAAMEQERLAKLNNDIMARLESAKAAGSEENRKLVETLRQTQEDLLRREDMLRELERQLNAKEKRLTSLEQELRAREARVKELEDLIAQKDEAVRTLKERIAQALLGFKDKGLTVEQKNGKIYVSLEAKLLFASGSTAVNEEGKKALIDLANVVRTEKDITILVEGHTDTDPYNGGGAIKDNWDLSVMRATAVTKIMTTEGKMLPAMLTAAGRGEFMPVADNATPEGKAKNRRIEIILTPNLDRLFEIINE